MQRAGTILATSTAGIVIFYRDDVKRVWRAGSAGVRCAVDYKRTSRRSGDDDAARAACHSRSAQRLYRVAASNGGYYVKVGQYLASLDHILPPEYITVLSSLFADAPRSPFSSIRYVVESELGKPLEEIFSDFSDEPVGAASLAQVHKAKLRDTGELVAVKVQHPEVERFAWRDLRVVELIVASAAALFPDFSLSWLSDEFRRHMPLEIDFSHEVANLQRVRLLLADLKDVVVPYAVEHLCTTRVIVMEFCEGAQVDDLEFLRSHNISSATVMSALSRLYCAMIFKHGFVHCDPHPGNLLIQPTGGGRFKLALLDHGIYQPLSPSFRLAYSRFWLSLVLADTRGVEEAGSQLGVGPGAAKLLACMVAKRTWNKIESGVTSVRAPLTAAEQEEVRFYIYKLMPQINEIVNTVPREMLLLFKTNDILSHIEKQIAAPHPESKFADMAISANNALLDDALTNCESVWQQVTAYTTYYRVLLQLGYISYTRFMRGLLGTSTSSSSHNSQIVVK